MSFNQTYSFTLIGSIYWKKFNQLVHAVFQNTDFQTDLNNLRSSVYIFFKLKIKKKNSLNLFYVQSVILMEIFGIKLTRSIKQSSS